MNQIEENGIQILPVIIKLDQLQEAHGEIKIQYWNKKERIMRVAKGAGISLLLALAVVFIPILHFVLVPALLLAMPIVAYLFYRQHSVILGGQGECPKCHQSLTIVRSKNVWPLEDLCETCHAVVKIELRK